MKIFSIITVCLNAPGLELTCESIVNQTFQDFEWIVIDGGSNGSTLSVFEKYKYRMDYFVSEIDGGIYDAMNKGISRASGEWVNFMNAGDCFVGNDVLQSIFMERHEYLKYDVIYGDAIFDYSNSPTRKFFPSETELKKIFFAVDSLNHQSTFIKRKAFYDFGHYDTAYKIIADGVFFLRLYINGRSFKHIGRTVAIFAPYGANFIQKKQHDEEKKCLHKYFTADELVEAKSYPRELAKKRFIKMLRQNVMDSDEGNSSCSIDNS